MHECAAAALGDGGVHHGLKAIARDHIVRAELGHAVRQRAFAGHQGVDLRQYRIERRQGAQLRPDAEQRFGLVCKAHPLARQHPHPRPGGRDMGQQVFPTLDDGGVLTVGGDGVQACGQTGRFLRQLWQGTQVRLRRLAPFRRAVVGVDVAVLVLADLKDKADVVAGDAVQGVAARTRAGPFGRRGRTGGDQQGQGEGEHAHRDTPSTDAPRARTAEVFDQNPAPVQNGASEVATGVAHSGLRAGLSCCRGLRPGVLADRRTRSSAG